MILLLTLILSACASPAPQFFGAKRHDVTLDGIRFAVFHDGADAEVILFTDQWTSPAASSASRVFAAHVEAPSAWDSNSVLMVLVETLLAEVQALTRDDTRARMARLEELYERNRLLRRR